MGVSQSEPRADELQRRAYLAWLQQLEQQGEQQRQELERRLQIARGMALHRRRMAVALRSQAEANIVIVRPRA